eukprot:15984407-Heterocapsa_arctica.AAC.1
MPKSLMVGLPTRVPLSTTSTATAASAAKPGEHRPRNRRRGTVSTPRSTQKRARKTVTLRSASGAGRSTR